MLKLQKLNQRMNFYLNYRSEFLIGKLFEYIHEIRTTYSKQARTKDKENQYL